MLSSSRCLLTWGGETMLLQTDRPSLLPELRREAGVFFREIDDGESQEETPTLFMEVLEQPADPDEPERRLDSLIDPVQGTARLGLLGAYTEDEAVLTVIAIASVLLRHRLLARHGDALHLHAAAVVRDDRALLLVGASGAGKTTLTAKLVQAGWRYLSDEDALVAGGRVYPLPRALRVKAWAVEQLGRQGESQSYQGFFDQDGERLEGSEHYQPESVPLGGVVLLQPDADGDARLSVVEPMTLLPEVLEQTQRERFLNTEDPSETVAVCRRYNRQLFHVLEQMLATVPVARLHYRLHRDLDRIPALLAEWMTRDE